MTRVEQLKLKMKSKKNVSFKKQPMLQQRETIISQGSHEGLEDLSGIVMASDTNSSNTACGKSLVINLPNMQVRVP
jgi:hypothetical protein